MRRMGDLNKLLAISKSPLRRDTVDHERNRPYESVQARRIWVRRPNIALHVSRVSPISGKRRQKLSEMNPVRARRPLLAPGQGGTREAHTDCLRPALLGREVSSPDLLVSFWRQCTSKAVRSTAISKAVQLDAYRGLLC